MLPTDRARTWRRDLVKTSCATAPCGLVASRATVCMCAQACSAMVRANRAPPEWGPAVACGALGRAGTWGGSGGPFPSASIGSSLLF